MTTKPLNFNAGKTDKSDELQLKEIARQFIGGYPDTHGMAYSAATKILRKYTGQKLNPDKVYWHRFSTAVSSSRSFTGWQHVDPPIESMTLIELVMRRFSARDQEDWDELQLYGGFYTDGPAHAAFDERNEVRMLPRDVMNDFWALDFSAAYTRKMQRFWATHSENFRTLAKSNFLAAAGQSLRGGHLSREDFQTVIHSVTDGLEPVTTLAMLTAKVAPKAGITLRTFDLGGYVARDILRIVDAQGRQVVYVPGETPAFHGFANEHDLYEWVRGRLADEASKAAFTQHFLRSAAARAREGEAFNEVVSQVLRQEWFERRIVDKRDEFIVSDAFEYLREIARQDMESDAFTLLTSNVSLRKQMWIGYLTAFTHVVGGLAPLGWPIALTLIGAGISNVGLNVDQAINGASASLRKAGVEAAILNSIFVVFNLPLLADIREVGEAGEASGAGDIGGEEARLPSEPVILVAPPVLGSDAEETLEGLEGNVVLDEVVPLASEGHLRGIHVLANGETWVSVNDLPYQVRYSEELNAWTVVDPSNPFGFYGAKPVRLNAQGEWELASEPKLAGGMDDAGAASGAGKPYSTTTSTFWDGYMQFNPEEESRLSEAALERQKEAIDILEVPTDELVEDDDGFDKFVDEWGDDHRVFKTEDGHFSGGNIKHYVQEDDAYNTFLRTGASDGHNDSASMIEALADDLEQVGFDNSVSLYRGGSGERGTSGITFRSGVIKPGDTLVNTDITSFSENPYVARNFANSQGGESSAYVKSLGTFDDTSIIYVIPAKSYLEATPIAPFASGSEEAESVFLPGHYFRIERIEEVVGSNYRFINVELMEIDASQSSGGVYDLRTGEPFSRAAYASKLGPDAKSLVDRFFP